MNGLQLPLYYGKQYDVWILIMFPQLDNLSLLNCLRCLFLYFLTSLLNVNYRNYNLQEVFLFHDCSFFFFHHSSLFNMDILYFILEDRRWGMIRKLCALYIASYFSLLVFVPVFSVERFLKWLEIHGYLLYYLKVWH